MRILWLSPIGGDLLTAEHTRAFHGDYEGGKRCDLEFRFRSLDVRCVGFGSIGAQ